MLRQKLDGMKRAKLQQITTKSSQKQKNPCTAEPRWFSPAIYLDGIYIRHDPLSIYPPSQPQLEVTKLSNSQTNMTHTPCIAKLPAPLGKVL